MAGNFAGASTQYLTNTASPIVSTGYPLTVGVWFNLAAVDAVNRVIFGISDTGTTNHYLLLRMNTTENVGVTGSAGGTESTAIAATAITPGAWNFAIGRFITSTNRRISLRHGSGLIEHQQGTTSRAPTGLDRLSIGALQTSGGASQPWDGLIGEIWYTAMDIQPEGTQLDNGLFNQLAFGGPFSVPHIAKDIIEYRSLRKHPTSDADEDDEVFHGALGRQTWTNTNGVTTGHHPPLPYWYVKPGQRSRVLPI